MSHGRFVQSGETLDAQGLPVIVTCMSHFDCIDQSGETLERVPRDGSYSEPLIACRCY